MARAKQVKMGQIWKDSKGRELEIVELQGADGKFAVLNSKTNRTLRRGPRALKTLIKRGPPGAQPAARPPTPAQKKKRARKQREMSEAQKAFFARGKARKAARKDLGLANPPVLSTQTPSYPTSSFRGSPPFEPAAGSFHGMNPPGGVFAYPDAYPRASNPDAELMDLMEEDHGYDHPPLGYGNNVGAMGIPFGPMGPYQQNPSHYPSELAKFVCTKISEMDPRHAEIPAMIMRAVGQAIGEWTTTAQRIAAANPCGRPHGFY